MLFYTRNMWLKRISRGLVIYLSRLFLFVDCFFAGGVPAWAQNLINVIHDMRIDQLKLINSGLGEGRGTQFEVVPFRGLQGTLDDPTVAPHNLPPLHHIDAIKALNGNQLTAYCLGYGIPGMLECPDKS
ncbi:hypothetical protein B0H14DRAFT_3154889 [Mycena olivaceomarginata]|nr:hypothetical protein B0H14DRAFT_3154889 [Mycena olivaceomarginata]